MSADVRVKLRESTNKNEGQIPTGQLVTRLALRFQSCGSDDSGLAPPKRNKISTHPLVVTASSTRTSKQQHDSQPLSNSNARSDLLPYLSTCSPQYQTEDLAHALKKVPSYLHRAQRKKAKIQFSV